MSSLLAYRPVSVLHRLPPRSQACPLSLHHVAPALRGPLPIVLAPIPAIARATLLAAREAGAVVALAAPRGDLGAWFAAVAAAADEIAPGLPFVIAAEASPGDSGLTAAEAARLVEGGATHLAFDAGAIDPASRAEVVAQAARAASEREIGVELALAPGDVVETGGAERLVCGVRARGVDPDAVGARLARPRDAADARHQARSLALLSRAAASPVIRRGPGTLELWRALAASPLLGCDDGGAAAVAAARGLSPGERAALEAGPSRAAPHREADRRLEALAWSVVTAFLEALGAAGTATALADHLRRVEG